MTRKRAIWSMTAMVTAGLVVLSGCSSPDETSKTVTKYSNQAKPVAKPSKMATKEASARSTPSSGAHPKKGSTTPKASKAAAAGTALAVLATLPVKGRAPKTGYSRKQFGSPWQDLDRNGCDQRNDVLRRDLQRFTLKAGTGGCLVLNGRFASPYTGRTIAFLRGRSTSNQVQIDHVVALGNAWETGAQQLSAAKRVELANDFLELLASDGHSNMSKGAGDAATWLPPSKGYRCRYVARQIAVKQRYRLWVTRPEHDAMARVLGSCPDERLPRTGAIKRGGGPERSVATPTTRQPTAVTRTTASKKTAKAKPATKGGTTVYFKNCTAVRSAGRAPIHRGQAGYVKHLDRDGDGIGCE